MPSLMPQGYGPRTLGAWLHHLCLLVSPKRQSDEPLLLLLFFFTCNGSSSDIWHCSVSITDIPKTCTDCVYIVCDYIKYVFLCTGKKDTGNTLLFVCLFCLFRTCYLFVYIISNIIIINKIRYFIIFLFQQKKKTLMAKTTTKIYLLSREKEHNKITNNNNASKHQKCHIMEPK